MTVDKLWAIAKVDCGNASPYMFLVYVLFVSNPLLKIDRRFMRLFYQISVADGLTIFCMG
jgi:hypothetical protein